MGNEIVARQVDLEYQESPMSLDYEETIEFSEECCIFGDQNFVEITNDDFDEITRMFGNEYFGDEEFEEDLNYSLPPTGKEKYDPEEIELLKELYDEWDEEPEQYAEALSLITGNKWEYGELHGKQGEWQNCIYDTTKITDDDLYRIETEYFNTGTAFDVECADGESVYVYCYSLDEDEMKEEIADAVGCDPEDVVLELAY